MQNHGPTILSAYSSNNNTMPADGGKPPCQNVAPKASSDGSEAKQITNVVYVAPRHARQAKSLLQQKGWLDKRYRMIKVTMTTTGKIETRENGNENIAEESKIETASPRPLIAVPISVPFVEVLAIFDELILD